MTQTLRTAFLGVFLLLFTGCNKDKFAAPTPVFMEIPSINLETNYAEESTAHHKISTLWLFVNGQPEGVFELPAVVPLLPNEGENEIILFPGVKANGISATRVIYDPYESITLRPTINLNEQQMDTLRFTEQQRTTGYKESAGLAIIENFDGSGINFERLNPGDTSIIKAPEGDPKFNFNDEPNGSPGLIAVNENKTSNRSATVLTYGFPPRVTNVYLEITYKSEINFEVGIIALQNDLEFQAPVAVVFPKEEWNKIYISFIDDVNSFRGVQNFKFYLAANLPEGQTEGKVWVDNIKLLWTQ